MNLPLSLPSPPLRAGERVAEGRERGIRLAFQVHCTALRPRTLSMNRTHSQPRLGVGIQVETAKAKR